jgi:hypothetical protein
MDSLQDTPSKGLQYGDLILAIILSTLTTPVERMVENNLTGT